MSKRIGKYLRSLGPGFITGSSDNDPSGIATYAQAGATLGFGGLWTALVSMPLSTSVQEAADRIALATGKGLGAAARDRFGVTGRRAFGLLLVTLLLANALNISADLLAIGAGMELLNLGPEWLWALLSGTLITILIVRGSYTVITRIFGLLSLTLFAYIVVLFFVHPPATSLLTGTFIPRIPFDAESISMLIAVFGTTISPYLFFWQPEHRVEEMRAESLGGNRIIPVPRRSRFRAREKVMLSRFDVITGIAFSTVVMWAIIAATASSIHGKRIESATEAAKALKPVAGSLAEALFAFGFIGTGMLAVPVLAGAGAAGLAGLLNKPVGFSHSWREAPFFYILVLVGSVIGMLLSLIDVNPIRLLVITAIVNGLAAVPFLFVVYRVSTDRKIMKELVSGKLSRTLMIATITLMSASALALIYSLLFNH